MRAKTHVALSLLLILTAGILCILAAGCEVRAQDEVEQRFRSALQKNPGDIEARMGLARVLMEREASGKAVDVLRQGQMVDPKNASLWEAVAQACSFWGKECEDSLVFQSAEGCLERLVDVGMAGAETFKILAYVQKRLGQHERSADSCATALRLDPEDVFSKGRLGYAYTLSGRYEKGLPLIREATEKKQDSYLLWWWLGDTQRLLGDYRPALGSLQRALRLAPRYQHTELSEVVEFTQLLLLEGKNWDAGDCHGALGDRHRELGRLDRAIVEYERALQVFPPDEHEDRGDCYSYIALCYGDVNKPETAIQYVQRAIDCYEQCDDHDSLLYEYQHLGHDLMRLAMQSGKQEFGRKAVAAYEMQEYYARQAEDVGMAADALANLAGALAEVHGVDDPRVKEYRRRIAAYIPEDQVIQDDVVASLIHTEALLRRLEKDYAGAKELFEMLASYHEGSEDIADLVVLPGMYNSLAGISWDQGNIDEAIAYGENSAARVSQLRSLAGIDEFKRNAGSDAWRSVFSGGLVRAALRKGDRRKAFDYSEQYKGRALLDLLGSRATEKKERKLQERRNERALVLAQVRELEHQLDRLDPAGETGRVRSLERNLSIEQTHYQRLAEDVSVAELEIKSFEDVESLKVGDVQPAVEGWSFVSYVVGDWGACAVVLSGDRVEGVEIDDASEEKLRSLIERFRGNIGAGTDMARDLTLEVEEEKKRAPEEAKLAASEELYELLIEPVLPYIKTKLVYISPDSVLNYLPFEALQKDGRYLIEDFAIAYAPSGSVLKICMDRHRNRRESVLALGNPNLKNPAFRLVHAENEVNSLEGLFPQVDVYTGDDATESVVSQHWHDYDILHFACHGELNLDEPMLTSLRLAPDDENDGYLHAGEVFEHDLSASLVVLSACNSALGELTSGNELMGLTRSFLYAGVPSIVASLWTVDDRSTSYLMQHFYKNLATMNKADALREAKLETMKKYPSPFHWAAFCLQGDYR